MLSLSDAMCHGGLSRACEELILHVNLHLEATTSCSRSLSIMHPSKRERREERGESIRDAVKGELHVECKRGK